MIPNVHLLGIQGSGKGTQSSLLVEKYNATYLASGNLFRQRAAVGDAFGLDLGQQLRAGRLLPDKLLVQTVGDYLSEHLVSPMLLCDGVIRTVVQREELSKIWPAHGIDQPFLIYLELSEEMARERVAKRLAERDLPEKQEYHAIYSGKLVQRDDDNPQALEERFRLFYSLTEPIVNAFQEEGRCRTINASQPVDTVQQEIQWAIEKQYPALA